MRGASRNTTLTTFATGAVLLASMLVGCRAPAIAAENDRLRARLLDLERHNEQLARRNAELAAELQRLAAEPDTPAAELLAAIPHPVELSIGRLSHARDTDGDGLPDEMIVYMRPLDGRGRFVQVTGDLHLSAVVVPADAAPIELGRAHLGPSSLRDAYRSGLSGTHYTVTVPLSLPAGADGAWVRRAQAVVSVGFTEAETGRTLTAERTISLRHSRADGDDTGRRRFPE